MDARSAAQIAIATLILALWILTLREAWRAWQPTRLLRQGRYAEAQDAAARLERSWLRVVRSVRQSSHFVIGCARHLAGDLEGSIATLARLHEEPRVAPSLRYAICAIDAANLVLLGRDHARAGKLLEEAARLDRRPEDDLLLALVRLASGDREAAQRLFEEARPMEGSPARLFGHEQAIFHALRGLYLVEVGRTADARRDLEIAARSPVASTYVDRARSIVQERGVDAEDPRSSLAPQVLAKEP